MRVFCASVMLVFSLLCFSQSTFAFVEEILNGVDVITGAIKGDPCAPGSQPAFESREEFIKVACGEGDIEDTLNTIRAKSGADALSLYTYREIDLETFSKSLKAFRSKQSAVLESEEVPKGLPSARERGSPTRCWLTSKNENGPAQELNFGNLRVVAVSNDKKRFADLRDRLNLPLKDPSSTAIGTTTSDCYLVEDFKMNEPISCEKMLSTVLKPESAIETRGDYAAWWGFFISKKIFGSVSDSSKGLPSIESAYSISKACKNPIMVVSFDRLKEIGPALIDAVGPLKNINFKNSCPKGQKY